MQIIIEAPQFQVAQAAAKGVAQAMEAEGFRFVSARAKREPECRRIVLNFNEPEDVL